MLKKIYRHNSNFIHIRDNNNNNIIHTYKTNMIYIAIGKDQIQEADNLVELLGLESTVSFLVAQRDKEIHANLSELLLSPHD